MNGEHFSMEVETIQHGFALGEAATGTIDPGSRELDVNKVEQLKSDLRAGRFDVPVVEGYFLPCGCIDGRCPHDGEAFNAVPNAAGGTLSLLVGELLTTESNLKSTDTTSQESLASLIAYLQSVGYGDQIGGHTGPAHGPSAELASGCGANDALAPILGQITEKPDVILGVFEKLGIAVDKEIAFPRMLEKAAALLNREGYFATGKDVSETLQAASPEGNCPALQGGHNELLIRLKMEEGMTLDRRALKEAYGDDYQVFEVDVWALKKAAETLSYTPEEADSKFMAMVAYQVGTALQLCGPSMEVEVH
jgi:hypothetical protein